MASSDGFETAAMLLPQELRRAAMSLSPAQRAAVEEIRLRTGRPPSIVTGEGEKELAGTGPVGSRELVSVIELATGASAHTAAESIRRGFVTVRGGCRIGLCGTAVVSAGEISGIRSLSSLSIRVPSERRGCADGVYAQMRSGVGKSALIVSPPGAGKTTLLRDLVRLLSDGGSRVSLADERGEVAAVWEGRPQLDVGMNTDVLTGAPKAQAAMMLLRAMNPEVLALDEITAPEDVQACAMAANCGVRIIATAHGADVEDLMSRQLYRQLLAAEVFDLAVVISRERGARRYKTQALQW